MELEIVDFPLTQHAIGFGFFCIRCADATALYLYLYIYAIKKRLNVKSMAWIGHRNYSRRMICDSLLVNCKQI